MKSASHIALSAAAAAHLLAACATAPPAPSDLQSMNFSDTHPTVLRVTVVGRVESVLHAGTAGMLALTREGGNESIGLEFENGELATYDLPPGRYRIDMIGPLACTGLTFETEPGADAVALGSLTARIIRNDNYNIALISSAVVTDAERAAIAHGKNGMPATIASHPIEVWKSAVCHEHRAGFGGAVLTAEEAVQAGLALVVIGVLVVTGIAVAGLADALEGPWGISNSDE